MMHYLAIEDVCFNDPQWLQYLAGLGRCPEEGVIETFVARGLVSAYAFVKTESFEKRKELLGPAEGAFRMMLKCIVERFIECQFGPMLRGMSSEDRLEFVHWPVWKEDYVAAYAFWLWAHKMQEPEDFFFSVTNVSPRKFGYVLWDKTRFRTLDICARDWEPESKDEFYAAGEHRLDKQRAELVKRAKAVCPEVILYTSSP